MMMCIFIKVLAVFIAYNICKTNVDGCHVLDHLPYGSRPTSQQVANAIAITSCLTQLKSKVGTELVEVEKQYFQRRYGSPTLRRMIPYNQRAVAEITTIDGLLKEISSLAPQQIGDFETLIDTHCPFGFQKQCNEVKECVHDIGGGVKQLHRPFSL